MSYGIVLVFPAAAAKYGQKIKFHLESAWAAYGPSHRGVRAEWNATVHAELAAVQRGFEISIEDEQLLGKYCFAIPPETADLFLSRTPWAKQNVAPFVSQIHRGLVQLKPSLVLGVWNAPLRPAKRAPSLPVKSETLVVSDYLDVKANELVLDVRAGT